MCCAVMCLQYSSVFISVTTCILFFLNDFFLFGEKFQIICFLATVAIDAGIKSSMNILLTCVLLALASVSVCGNFLVFFTLYRFVCCVVIHCMFLSNSLSFSL